MELTICKNKNNNKYSIRKDGHLFFSIDGYWIEETKHNNDKIWEVKHKRKVKKKMKNLINK